jgi:hypothetical protein
MARRGQCRCGTILEFEPTSLGYKTRCPQCKAVVRLRLEAAHTTRKPSAAAVAVPAGPPPLPASAPALPSAPPADFSVDLLPGPVKQDMPAVSTELIFTNDHESPPSAPRRERDGHRDPSTAAWWLFGVVALVVIGAVTAAALLWG